eukprot:3246461-Rhodomonas_salina.3
MSGTDVAYDAIHRLCTDAKYGATRCVLTQSMVLCAVFVLTPYGATSNAIRAQDDDATQPYEPG